MGRGSTDLDSGEGADDRSACRRRALDLLARREHSRLELERKLGQRGHPPDLIAGILDALTDEGLIAADRFAESFVRSRAGRGQGPVRIRHELAERGVEHGEAYVDDAAYDWRTLAGEARIKRFGSARPASFKERARQARFLQYRGFTGEQIAAALEFGDESD